MTDKGENSGMKHPAPNTPANANPLLLDWTAPKPRYTRGVQAKFAFNASSASKGAVLDDY